jgi:hypothetical protein
MKFRSEFTVRALPVLHFFNQTQHSYPQNRVLVCDDSKFIRPLGYYAAWGDLKPTFRDYLLHL